MPRFTGIFAALAGGCLMVSAAAAQSTPRPEVSIDQPRLAPVGAMDMRLAMDPIDVHVAPLAMPRLASSFATSAFRTSPRAPWAVADSADSLYRLARETLNAGEYRRAAQLFAQIGRQYPNSQYRADAAYWRSFALYRIGGLAELHEALQVLDSMAPAPRAVAATTSVTVTPAIAPYAGRVRRGDTEAAVLATRIRAALAARGDAAAAAQIARTADASGPTCDEEDAQLRVEALNALVQMDPKSADPTITKVLARRDACDVPLRRGAIALIARSNDARSTELLINSARNDPALEVRAEAIRWLGRAPDDKATAVLAEIATSSDKPSLKPSLQRIAVRALVSQQSPASRQAIRNLMTRADVPSDVRITALHYAGQSDMAIADLAKIYDASTDRSTRDEVISLLEQRQEPEAADKLIDIAHNGTDPDMRRRAIAALSRKKDPRTTKLLM
ncbi:MAG TPA: HEAT repeat domain-containing protein, partial [Candidatus Elarobacter sp.]|nr:HEAT repeat domain-containing protein [Candidatus Elarobacter sp.]